MSPRYGFESRLEREAWADERAKEEWESERRADEHAAALQPAERDPLLDDEGYADELDDPNRWRPETDPFDRFECDERPSEFRWTI